MGKLKVVYNNCYGGFSLSEEARKLYNEKRINNNLGPVKSIFYIRRDDPILVEIVEELGEKVNGTYSKLEIDEIPIEYKDCYHIREYDGTEYIDCDPKLLIEHKYKSLNVSSLSDEQCRENLKKIVSLLNSPDC